jgi:hypothetical protein
LIAGDLATYGAQVELASVELEARNLRAWLSGVAADQALSDDRGAAGDAG